MWPKFSQIQLIKNIDFFEEVKEGVQRATSDQHSKKKKNVLEINFSLTSMKSEHNDFFSSGFANECELSECQIICIGFHHLDNFKLTL